MLNIPLLSTISTTKLCALSYFLNSLMKECKEREDQSRHFHFHLHKPGSVNSSSVSDTGIRYSAQLRAFIYRVQGQNVNDLFYRYVAHYLGMQRISINESKWNITRCCTHFLISSFFAFQVWSIKTPRSTRSAIIKDPRQKHVKKIWLTAQSEVPLAKVITLRAYRQTLVDQKTRQDETENRQ